MNGNIKLQGVYQVRKSGKVRKSQDFRKQVRKLGKVRKSQEFSK